MPSQPRRSRPRTGVRATTRPSGARGSRSWPRNRPLRGGWASRSPVMAVTATCALSRRRSRLEAADRSLRLIVEAEGARFPLTVDPVFVHEAELLGHGDPVPPADAMFGSSVSVSGDTVVAGSPLDDTTAGLEAGSAYVFVRSGTTWTVQQRLLAPDGAASDWFGS